MFAVTCCLHRAHEREHVLRSVSRLARLCGGVGYHGDNEDFTTLTVQGQLTEGFVELCVHLRMCVCIS